MGKDVLVLLSSFYGEYVLGAAVFLVVFSLCLTALFGLEICINAHEARNATNVGACREATDQVYEPVFGRRGADVQKNAKLWFKVTAETLEEPKVG